MSKLNKICLAGVTAAVVLWQMQCTTNIAGTSTVGNPQKITAVITDSTGTAVQGVPVAIVQSDFNPLKNGIAKIAAGTVKMKDTSDSRGYVEFWFDDTGRYNLISTEAPYQYSLYVREVSLGIKDINLDTVRLKKPGTVTIQVDSSVYLSGGSFIIPGTNIVHQVSAPGTVTLDVPAGTISLYYVNQTGDTVAGGPSQQRIDVAEGEGVLIAETPGGNSRYADTIWVPVIYYDFHADGSNPEFECDHMGGERRLMVAATLDADNKPALGSNPYISEYIKYWFRDWNDSAKGDFTVPQYSKLSGGTFDAEILFNRAVDADSDTAFKNIVIRDSIPLVDTGSGFYEFSSLAFFPIDNVGFGKEGKDHNYAFTMEMSITFVKTPGKSFRIMKDDDFWCFVEGKRELDKGGISQTKMGLIEFDTIPELIDGSTCTLKLFCAERHSTESTLHISTNLFEKQ